MVSSSQVNKRSAMAVGAGLDPEAAEEFKRVQAQNEDLKKQIEAMAHTQAKIAAKHARYRNERKELIEQGLINDDAKSRNDSFEGLDANATGGASSIKEIL